MSAYDDNELEKKLLEVGEKLLDPLPSLPQMLLQLLDELFFCLSEMEQDPPGSIQDALSPLKKALVAERLFKHTNVHVKVAVTSCIIEVTRITAPDAPYDDDKMREVLQLVVSSFKHLAEKHSPSYTRRTSILDTVAKARVFFLMLDLGCDALLIEMFQHFLKALRDDHPIKVVLDMENIMTLVLEESDDIPAELLSPILHYVRKDNEVPQVSQRLAEQVLRNCASKLETYLTEAVKSSGVSLDKYSNVVASICKARGEMEKTAAEGEPSCHIHKSSPEPGELGPRKVPQPCSVKHQLAKVKQSIVDTISSVRQFRSELETKEQSIVDTLTSVRQFRSEIKKKEDNLEASLQEVDVLGEKILGIDKILNS